MKHSWVAIKDVISSKYVTGKRERKWKRERMNERQWVCHRKRMNMKASEGVTRKENEGVKVRNMGKKENKQEGKEGIF